MLREQLKRLAGELSLPPPTEHPKGLFAFELNPQVRVDLRMGEPGLTLSAVVASLPKQALEDLFLLLMRANYLGRGTGGGKIGLSPDEKSLTLTHDIPYELSYDAFKRNVEDFINYLLYWREEVAKFERERQP